MRIERGTLYDDSFHRHYAKNVQFQESTIPKWKPKELNVSKEYENLAKLWENLWENTKSCLQKVSNLIVQNPLQHSSFIPIAKLQLERNLGEPKENQPSNFSE